MRWRDIQWVEFEAEEAPGPAPAPALPQFGDRVPGYGAMPIPAVAPLSGERSAPRYGRAIAPLPHYLIGSAPAAPRTQSAPAPVRRTPPTSGLARRVARRGTPFPRRGAGTRRSRGWIAAALLGAAVAAVAYRGDRIFAALGKAPPAPERAASDRPAPARTGTMVPAAALAAGSSAAGASPTVPVAVAAPAMPAGITRDEVHALLTQAKAGDAQAQYALAVLYARGQGVAQDYAAAASWFREAAIAGNVAAQYNLGVMYERGLGLGENMNEALIWYHSAAAKDYPAAEYNLALSYADGRGAPQDFVAAARWYLRAARQGLVAAMVNFAIQCENGAGIDRSPVIAYAWYRAAAARGDRIAAKRAGELFEQFSMADRKAAKAAVDQVAASIRPPAPEPAPAPAPARSSGDAAESAKASAQSAG